MNKNKRSNLLDVAYAVLTIFVLGIAFFVTSFGYEKFVNKAINNTQINSSAGSKAAFTDTRDTLNSRLDYVVFGVFIGFVLSILITGWFVGGNPLFMFIYFIGLCVLIAIASILSYTWGIITVKAVFTGTIANYPITDLLISHLHIYTTILGFLGMFVSYAKPYITGEAR